MSTMYGYDVAPKEDYFVGLAERAVSRLSASAPPDASLFFTFPILRHLPSWFPGTQFKQFALEGKKWVHEMRDIPLGFVQKQIVRLNLLQYWFILLMQDPYAHSRKERRQIVLLRISWIPVNLRMKWISLQALSLRATLVSSERSECLNNVYNDKNTILITPLCISN